MHVSWQNPIINVHLPRYPIVHCSVVGRLLTPTLSRCAAATTAAAPTASTTPATTPRRAGNRRAVRVLIVRLSFTLRRTRLAELVVIVVLEGDALAGVAQVVDILVAEQQFDDLVRLAFDLKSPSDCVIVTQESSQ